MENFLKNTIDTLRTKLYIIAPGVIPAEMPPEAIAIRSGLIGVQSLENIIQTIIYSATLDFPLSTILIGPSGCGKSSIICQLGGPHFHRTDSVSSAGLFQVCQRDSKNELKFIVIPDFNPTLSRKNSTVDGTLANLLTLTADGTTRVDDGREAKENRHAPVGVITAATREMYDKFSRKWYALGLRRRIFPLFYRYSEKTIRDIQRGIASDKINLHSLPVANNGHKLGDRQIPPRIPPAIESEITTMSVKLAVMMGTDKVWNHNANKSEWVIREVLPITPQMVLRQLARSRAVREKRKVVTNADVDFLYEFMKFCDPAHACEL